MRCLLVVPPAQDASKYRATIFANFTSPPLGLAYIAAVLEEKGYTNVRILDSQALHFGLQELEEVFRRFKADIVGIQVLTSNVNAALETAKIAKKVNQPIVVFGGYHATAMDTECLDMAEGSVDYIVRGEGDYVFAELVESLEKGEDTNKIEGLTFYDNDQKKVVRTPDARLIEDLDSIPFPARLLLPLDKYRIFGSSFPATTMITTRGCPFGCDFCSVTHFYGKKFRRRSPKNIAEEMAAIHDLKNLAVAFVDDLFFISTRRVKEMCYEISHNGCEMYWGATCRADRGSVEIFNLMRRVGCRLLFVGVESGSQEILDNIQKKTNTRMIERFFDNTRKAKMDTLASISFGFPGETKETIRQTTEWVARRLDPDLALFTIATPYPGTPFYNEALKRGLIKEREYSKYNLFNPIMETMGLTRDELKEMTKWAYKRFYLRPEKIIGNVTREFGYSLESYGLRQFLYNGRVFFKGILDMRTLASI